jgi:hypothetical protein
MLRNSRFAVLAIGLGLAGCAAVPQDPDAFREDRVKEKKVLTATLANVSFDTAAKRLLAYGGKCLNMKEVAVSQGIILSGNGETEISRYNPKYVTDATHAMLTLQFKYTARGTFAVQKMPEDGLFFARIDLEKVGAGTEFTAYYIDQAAYRFQNVATRALEWVTDEKHLCPDLKVGI